MLNLTIHIASPPAGIRWRASRELFLGGSRMDASKQNYVRRSMAKKLLIALTAVTLVGQIAAAQDAKTVLQTSTKAMGDVKSIQFSGTGHLAAVGQAWNPTSPWPETIVKSSN